MRRLVLLVAVFLSAAASAHASPPGGIPPALPPPPSVSVGPAPGASGSGGLLGSPDTTVALGGFDASCSHLAQASPDVIKNCAASGNAQSPFPPSNYGTDVHVDTGLSDLPNVPAAIVQSFISGLYSAIAHVLTWILLGLGLAFSFDLFATGGSAVQHGLATSSNLFSGPLIPVIVLIGGAFATAYWFKGDHGKGISHLFSFVVLLIVALLIVANPVGILGTLNTTANALQTGALAAFSGSGGGTGSGFANATPGMWKVSMEEPWCAMEFGSEAWCMEPPDPAMRKARADVLNHLPQALGDQGSSQLAAQQAPIERTRLADARTNGELFLSFITNSNARNGKNDDWTFYHALLNDHPELAAIRGASGAWERFSVLILSGVVGILFLVLLTIIAYQLVVNKVFFLFYLLLLPVVMFAPAFGEKGRSIFFGWITRLGLALFRGVIYAVYLGIILLVTTVVFQMPFLANHWLLQWLVLGIVYLGAIHYRKEVLQAMTGGLYKSHHHPDTHAVKRLAVTGAAAYAWKRAPQKVAAVHQHHYEGDRTEQHVHQHLHVDPNGEDPIRVPNDQSTIEGNAKELPDEFD